VLGRMCGRQMSKDHLHSRPSRPEGKILSDPPLIVSLSFPDTIFGRDWDTDWTIRGSIPGRGKTLSSSPKRPDRYWGGTSLLFSLRLYAFMTGAGAQARFRASLR
jgi:hypothetical protein